ncbi:hypothetical protein KE513_08860 [Oscillospiraceae bacterium Marseille-Q3528]|nr:hypothetical protein [Oscillospiraceae bacterium Marseille-Q3528]
MNGFVEYLNSTNNVGGNSTGSLAETQVKSKYFDLVKVNRKLGTFISDTVKGKDYHAFILTGHAGDGKTSVLVQVLKELQYLYHGEGLNRIKSYGDFMYVKDMSEIAEEQQTEVLRQSLEAPQTNQSSLIISNTGPLLNTFLRLAAYSRKMQGASFDEEDRIELQSKLLSQLDTNSDEEIVVEGYPFYLVNIARVDNVSFSTQILKKLVAEELWVPCGQCKCQEKCPIYNNVKRVRTQLDRVSRFVESLYRYLYENDKRMTIRQMVGQLSYALTGNLTCDYVENHYIKEPFFNYSFANLFFGFVGLNESRNSWQIKGVSQLRLLGLDRIALDVDYKLFVNNDFQSFFTPDVSNELLELKKKHQKLYQILDEESAHSASAQSDEAKLRRAIRRFYIMFSADLKEDIIFNQLFGRHYTLYESLISKKQPKSVLRNVQTLTFKALYIKNTGFLPDGSSELPLTLRRDNSVFQNVMLVLGSVSKNDLVIVQKPVSSHFEDSDGKQRLYLNINGQYFMLTLPMLSYFEDLVQGSISSNSNPALTHGIAKLDTLLLDEYGEDLPDGEDDCELKLLINTTRGQEIRYFAFDGSKLSILS